MALLLTTTTLPGLLTKTAWFVTVFQTSRLTRLSTKRQTGATNYSAYAKTSEKKLHISKVKHAKITRYNMSKKSMNN